MGRRDARDLHRPCEGNSLLAWQAVSSCRCNLHIQAQSTSEASFHGTLRPTDVSRTSSCTETVVVRLSRSRWLCSATLIICFCFSFPSFIIPPDKCPCFLKSLSAVQMDHWLRSEPSSGDRCHDLTARSLSRIVPADTYRHSCLEYCTLLRHAAASVCACMK